MIRLKLKLSYDIRYFFLVLVALLVLGLFNGLVFLPVLLIIVGPPAQVTAQDSADSLPPATPQPSPGKRTYNCFVTYILFSSQLFSEVQSPSSKTPASVTAKQRLWEPRQHCIQLLQGMS